MQLANRETFDFRYWTGSFSFCNSVLKMLLLVAKTFRSLGFGLRLFTNTSRIEHWIHLSSGSARTLLHIMFCVLQHPLLGVHHRIPHVFNPGHVEPPWVWVLIRLWNVPADGSILQLSSSCSNHLDNGVQLHQFVLRPQTGNRLDTQRQISISCTGWRYCKPYLQDQGHFRKGCLLD